MPRKMLKEVTWIKLTILLGSSVFFSSCCSLDVTKFPQEPKLVKYEKDPVLEFDKKNKTYLITNDLLENSLKQHIYIQAIMEWKKENGIK